MKFSTIAAVQETVQTMLEADATRGENRALINAMFNGSPPYTPEEQQDNNILTNVNFLDAVKLASDARRQFYNAFLKPGRYLNVTLDYGPVHKKDEWGRYISREINRVMKKRLKYIEVLRSAFAATVLHGIGPSNWNDLECWCPDSLGIEDVLLPSGTFLTMENAEFFAVRRCYTPAKLWKMTHGYKVDPAWNVKLAEKSCKKASEEVIRNMPYQDPYQPEKMAELYKTDPGLFASDAVKTIDCWDFFFREEEGKTPGWSRKIILDDSEGDRSTEYLYDSKGRMYASQMGQIIHFQFGDASAVAPFRYHSVRSLGFMLYAVCHLQNRLRCRLNDATFENLMMLVRVDESDRNRINKVDLHGNVAVLPKELEFVKAGDRYTPDKALAQSSFAMNRQTMIDLASSYTQDYDWMNSKQAQTATETMAQVNSAAAMVGAMLTQAYNYQVFQYQEIARRFCKKHSKDPDVRAFRLCCLKSGVPEEALDVDRWTIECERVLGSGNKTLEIAQVDRLMAARNLYDPQPQRDILHKYTEVITDDPQLADRLAPTAPRESEAVHEAQLAIGTLMLGLPVSFKAGLNHIEYAETIIASMGHIIQRIMQTGGVGTQQDVIGLQNMAQHAVQHIQVVAQDKNEKARVKEYMDALGNAMNMVKAFAQRQQEQAGAGGQGGPDPETMGKVQSQKILAEAKAANMRESHAQRTAQRQIQWEMEQGRKQADHEANLAKEGQQVQLENAALDVNTAAEIRRQNAKAAAEPLDTGQE